MCKCLQSRGLLIILSILLAQLGLGQADLLPGDRSLTIDEAMRHDLHHQVLQELDPYQTLLKPSSENHYRVVSLLHTLYPELISELEDTPADIRSRSDVSEMILAILQEEASQGLSPDQSPISKSIPTKRLDHQSLAILQFLKAYELFKSQRIDEAEVIWTRLLKNRKGEQEYVAYYSGLTALLQGRYEDAITRFGGVRQDYRLLYHKPYYLAASHYALQDYQTVVNSFSNLVHSSTVGNREGLQVIVAYAFYKLEDYTEAVTSFEEIAQQRTLTPEEAYLLGSALQKVGRSQEAEKVWAQVSSLENDLQDRATYDYALQLHDNGRYEEAIEAFKKFLGSKEYDQTDIHYNLALLYGKTEQYDLVVHHAIELSTTPRKEDANRLLEKTVNHVQSPELYKAIATSIMTSTGEHEMLKKSLYQRGVESLKQHDFDSANQYFNLLADADPLIEQRGEVAAWKGIMAYHEDDYPKAQRYLTNFLKSKSISTETQLVFDANYFLGYTFFKLGQHQQSLGHLTQVLHHPLYKDATTSIKVDAALRVSDNYFLLADYTNAQKAYEQTLESPGSHQPYALWQTAVIAELQNRPYDQIMILERLLDEFPHSSYAPDGAFAKANTLFGLQKYGRAAEVYERLLNNATVNTQIKEEATSQLGLIAINAGDYDRAATYYNSLINSSQNDELKERSRLALKEIYGNYTYDTDAYINLIKTENGNEESEAVDEALFDLAYNTYAEGKYTESISQWKRYLSEFADGNRRQEANYYLAKCYQEDAKWVESTTHYKQAIDGENQKIREESTTLIKAILFEKIEDYQEYITFTVGHPSINQTESFNKFVALIKTEQSGEAAAFITEAFDGDEVSRSRKKEFLQELQFLLIKNQEWNHLLVTQKEKILQPYVANDPRSVYYTALAQFNLDQLDASMSSITGAYDILLDNPAWLAKAIILQSDIHVLQNHISDANAALQALIETDSQVPPSLITVAKNRLENLSLIK